MNSDKVVVSAADVVAGPWKQYKGNVFTTSVPLATKYTDFSSKNTLIFANQIFVNSEMMPQCRFPNLVGTNAAHTTFNDNGNTDAIYYPAIDGGYVGAILWKSHWFSTITV